MVRESDKFRTPEAAISQLRHELRTPINHIIGYTEMLQEEAEDRGRHDLVPEFRYIWTAGQQLLRAVNENLSEAEMGSTEVRLPNLRKQMHKPLERIIGRTRDIEKSAEDRGLNEIIDDIQKIRLAAYNLSELVNHKTLAAALAERAPAFDMEFPHVVNEEESYSPDELEVEVSAVGCVLVVDDNDTSREMLSRRLERQGHRVEEAENGRVALDMVARNSFDLILLDVMMPEVDGYQALQMLKSNESFRHIPVIMLSALEEMDSAVKCIEMGAEDYLSKPYNAVLLKARIDACLEKKRLRDHDVLNLKKIETMNAQLEQRVEDRVKELQRSNDRLVNEIAQRKRLEERLQEQVAEMAVADEIAHIITSTLDIEQDYEKFALEMKKVVSVDRMNINVINHEPLSMITKYVYGIERPSYPVGEPRPIEGTQAHEVLKTGNVLLRQDIAGDDRFSMDKEFQRIGIRSAITLPLTSKGKIIGTLGLRSCHVGAYGKKEQTILERIAKQIAPAVENAQLFEATTREKERLARTLAQLRALLDGVDAGILLLGNDDQTVLWSNQRFAQIFGKESSVSPMDGVPSQREVRNLLCNALADPERVLEMTDQVISDRTFRGTQELETIYPEPRIIQRFTTPVQDESGEYLGRLWVYYDVTEQRNLEQQLLQSQKMESVGRLAGGIAHDFNNLLTPIMGYATLSSMALPMGHPCHGHLDEVRKAAERASNLTHQLLTFSKGQLTQTKVTDLNELVVNMDDLLRPVIREDIELVTLPSSDLARVKVDPGQIEQVLLNLIINARDAMPDGGKLTIETANVSADKDDIHQYMAKDCDQMVMLAVGDNGTGMSEEVKSRIFEPFFTTKDHGKGTGLGLSTCYGIIKQSGGHIEVSSELGQGTTFRIYLPATNELPEESSLTSEAGSLPTGTEMVLLVEDESAVRSMVATILLNLGYTVLQAATGEEALRMVEENPDVHISLLLTDVVMPQMGGVELANRFSADHPNTRVLFISGYADQPIVPDSVVDPDFEVIRKPFMPATLAIKVREALDR